MAFIAFANMGRTFRLYDEEENFMVIFSEETNLWFITDLCFISFYASFYGFFKIHFMVSLIHFSQWKEITKRISDFVLLEDLNVNLHHRDNIIRLQSLIHHLLSAKRFKNSIAYGWYKSGYTHWSEENLGYGEFEHPVKYCFCLTLEPCSCLSCDNPVLLRCGRCEKFLCFFHFFGAITDNGHLCALP